MRFTEVTANQRDAIAKSFQYSSVGKYVEGLELLLRILYKALPRTFCCRCSSIRQPANAQECPIAQEDACQLAESFVFPDTGRLPIWGAESPTAENRNVVPELALLDGRPEIEPLTDHGNTNECKALNTMYRKLITVAHWSETSERLLQYDIGYFEAGPLYLAVLKFNLPSPPNDSRK